MTTIPFTHLVNGALTDVTSVALSDPSSAFGVQRLDTGASVVAAGTALARTSAGTYSYSFADPAPGLTYRYFVLWVYDGVTERVERTIAGGGGAAGRYATQADVENVFGIENVRAWSNLDNASTAVDIARVQLALDRADAEIDDALRDGPYAVPLATEAASAATVRHWAAVLAGVWLYSARGQRDNDVLGSRYAALLAAIHVAMGQVRSGICTLQAQRNLSTASTAPIAVR